MRKATLVDRKQANKHKDWNKKPDIFLQHRVAYARPFQSRVVSGGTTALAVSPHYVGEKTQRE